MKDWILRTFFPQFWREREQLVGGLHNTKDELNRMTEKALQASLDRDELARRRNVAWPRPATRIPANVILKEFNVPLDQGLMAALHQELDDQIQDLLDVVSQPPSATLTAEHRLHLAGGIEHLRLFQKSLLDRSAAASTADPDLDDDKKEGV
jgi:hypothetical protein